MEKWLGTSAQQGWKRKVEMEVTRYIVYYTGKLGRFGIKVESDDVTAFPIDCQRKSASMAAAVWNGTVREVRVGRRYAPVVLPLWKHEQGQQP